MAKATEAVKGAIETRVLRVRRPSAVFIALTLERPVGFVFGTGQVIELGAPSGERGYFAISSAPCESELEVLIKASEPRSSLEELQEGSVVTIGGPWGLGYELASAPNLWLLGIGSAYSALRAAILAALAEGRHPESIHLMLGVRLFSDIPDRAELEAWAGAGVRIALALSGGADSCLALAAQAGWSAVAGRLPALIATMPADVARNAAIRVAGSEDAEDVIVAALMASGLKSEAIQRNFHADARAGASARPGE